MLRVLARALRTSAPSIYWRARNGVSLAQWCTSRALGIHNRPDDSAYDDAFWALHDSGDWDRLAALIVERFRPQALADVGCGDGKLLAAMNRVAPGVRATGYDSSIAALAAARKRGVMAEQFDLAFTARRSSDALAARVRGCEVAVSLETAEHLPPWSARPFVHVLTQAPVVVFSAAQPMQGGTMHMNERPRRYWIARFAEAGFDLHPGDAAFREDVGQLDLPWWYARNIQVFRRRTA
jgi:SAM-dependent methyltransferase